MSQQYISYVQVGGAYAHQYSRLLEYLEIKTVIFTDIDYPKTLNVPTQIIAEYSTNSGLNSYFFADPANSGILSTIENIHKWILKPQLGSPHICVQSQSDEDGYARTLEEAMLCRLLNISVSDVFDRDYWAKVKTDHKINIRIPYVKKDADGAIVQDKFGVRDIVKSTEDYKTDFMYSVIINSKHEVMLPNYIQEGLNWLMQ